MDDERIERALRQGPPDEPAYVPGVAGRVASESGASSAGDPSTAARPDGSPDLEVLRPDGVRLRRAGSPARRSMPVAIAAALVIAIGGLFIWQTRNTGPGATPAPSLDLLGRLRQSYTIRVAVSSGPPQTVSGGGAYIGFDVDVAEAIAGELGLDARVSAVADFDSTESDLMLPGGTGGAPTGSEASEPYAYWPIWLAAGPESPVTDLASLDSARVCVVEGSTGAAWLARQGTAASTVEQTSDDECVAAVTDGTADAMVSASLLADEVVSRGLRSVLPTPVAEESWTAVVAPGSDAVSLLDAVDRAIAKLRASGRLEDISRSSFGGQDVTVRQP